MGVFISYSRKNLEDAEKLCGYLKDAGKEIWMDLKNIEPVSYWERDIREAINKSDCFLALFSQEAIEKEGFFHKEIKIALERKKGFSPDRHFIIPARLEECDISGYEELKEINRIDLFPPDKYKDGVSKILNAIQKCEREAAVNKIKKQEEGTEYEEIISQIKAYKPSAIAESAKEESSEKIYDEINHRMEFIKVSIKKTVESSKQEIMEVIERFRDWMLNGAIVRVLGVGRAKLAAAIPANRLAHGGARVYIQDNLIPMPNSIKGGGIIAVSASGETESVIKALEDARCKNERIFRIGIAQKSATKFQEKCNIFIGIEKDTEFENPLQALVDTEEFVISMLLDAMVVAAGKLAGYDDVKWRLGHEDIGGTGPHHDTKLKPVNIST